MLDPKYLLGDEEMQQFIAEGCLTLKSSLPASLHQDIYQRTEEVFAKEGNPGNNVLPRIPGRSALQQVFDDPVVRGALTSVVGEDYIMHTHRHCHINPPGSEGWWLAQGQLLGLSQGALSPQSLGDDFLLPTRRHLGKRPPPRSCPVRHYYNNRAADEQDERHLPVLGEGWHLHLGAFLTCGTGPCPTARAANRYMMKFQFTPPQRAEPAHLEHPSSGVADQRLRAFC